MAKNTAIPGIVRPAEGFRSTDRKNQPKTIEEKRQTAIRSIERYLGGDKGAPKLEQFDPAQNAPVIRVLYGSAALPIFDGKPAAVIDPKADRKALWKAIADKIRQGEFDAEIEQVSRQMIRNLNAAKAKRDTKVA